MNTVFVVKQRDGLLSIGLVTKDVISHLRESSCGSCNYICRDGNKVAHAFPKLSLSLNVDVLCFEEIPNCIATLVADDFN